MICPKCGSDRLRRSHTRGFKERLLKSLGYKAFRCRAPDCDWRGTFKVNPITEILEKGVIQGKNYILFTSVLILCILMVLYIISALDTYWIIKLR